MKYIPDLQVFDYTVVENNSKNSAVLCTLEGYATFSGLENRNSRYYRPGFWKKMLDENARVQEMIKTKTFFGSSRHPYEDECPVPEYENTACAFREYKIDDKGVWIVTDVLDTPAGRIIKTFVDYGSKIGISTRAFGEQQADSEGRICPVEDKYSFVTWDLVTFPAFSNARLQKVNDSFNLDIKESDLNISKEDFLNNVSKLSKDTAKSLCDYAGLDFQIKDEIVSLNESLEKAVDRIVELENSLKLIKESKSKSKGNIWDEIELKKEEKVKMLLDEAKKEYTLELQDLTKAFDELMVENLKISKENNDLKCIQENLDKSFQEEKNSLRLSLKDKEENYIKIVADKENLEKDLNLEKVFLNDVEIKLKESIELLNSLIDQYEQSIKEKEILKRQLDETENLIKVIPKDNKQSKSITNDDSEKVRPLFLHESEKSNHTVKMNDEDITMIEVLNKIKKLKTIKTK